MCLCVLVLNIWPNFCYSCISFLICYFLLPEDGKISFMWLPLSCLHQPFCMATSHLLLPSNSFRICSARSSLSFTLPLNFRIMTMIIIIIIFCFFCYSSWRSYPPFLFSPSSTSNFPSSLSFLIQLPPSPSTPSLIWCPRLHNSIITLFCLHPHISIPPILFISFSISTLSRMMIITTKVWKDEDEWK